MRRHFVSRIDNALRRAGLDRAAVLGMAERDLLDIPGLGVGSLDVVRLWAQAGSGTASQPGFDWDEPELHDHAVLPEGGSTKHSVAPETRPNCPWCGRPLPEDRTYLCRDCGA